MDEVKVCQMLALLQERLGGEEIRPKLTIVGKEGQQKPKRVMDRPLVERQRQSGSQG